jgi:hypothetical protein
VGVAVIKPLALLVLLIPAAPVEAARIALVVGNDKYVNVQALHTATADAKAVAKALKEVGFSVTLKEDLSQQAMKVAWRGFKERVSGGDEVVFYFAGHGVQLRGTNYLIPTDIDVEGEDQVSDDSMPLQRILDDLAEQRARFTLAIIDACRDNPFKGSGRAIGSRGLAIVPAATGQMVLYSAGAGQEALDQLGPNDSNPNGVFTRVLIKEMKKSGVSAAEMLSNVRRQVVVLAKSANPPREQVPALYDQTLNVFYFVPPTSSGSSDVAQLPYSGSAQQAEQSFWDRIRSSTDAADFTDYTTQFPDGVHAAEARLMLRKLTGAAANSTGRPQAAPTGDSPIGSSPAVAPAKRYPATLTISNHPGEQWVTNASVSDGLTNFSLLAGKGRQGGYVGLVSGQLRAAPDKSVTGTARWHGGKVDGYAPNNIMTGTVQGRVAANNLDLQLDFGTIGMKLRINLAQ